MSKVRCGYCHEYLDSDEAVRNGVQSFHPDHVKPRTQKPRKPIRKKKPKDDIPDSTRRLVSVLDGGRCRFCGMGGGMGLHTHHVRYRSEDHSAFRHEQSNLITLCLGCHDKVHADKGRYQPLCLGIIWLRAVYGDKQMTIPRLERLLEQ